MIQRIVAFLPLPLWQIFLCELNPDELF